MLLNLSAAIPTPTREGVRFVVRGYSAAVLKRGIKNKHELKGNVIFFFNFGFFFKCCIFRLKRMFMFLFD